MLRTGYEVILIYMLYRLLDSYQMPVICRIEGKSCDRRCPHIMHSPRVASRSPVSTDIVVVLPVQILKLLHSTWTAYSFTLTMHVCATHLPHCVPTDR